MVGRWGRWRVGDEAYNIIEFRQQFSVKEEISGRGEFICYSIQEDFWTVVFVLLVCALLAFDGEETELEDVDAVAEEDCFTACDID